MKRFIAIITAIAMTFPLLGTPSAFADSVTGPWTWTDLSAQLTERNNRPVWAMAYANGSWFYTDGQSLWNGGQVYRYDGFTQINITSDVRNAGLDRVDDIVSDGQSALFLQDVVRMDNQLKTVGYRNGSYVNMTGAVRNVLNSNEGVSSVVGKNGTWYIVTTNARLFRWDGTGTNPVQITLPSGLVNAVDYTPPAMVYNVNHGSASNGFGRIPLAIVPVTNNQWLLAGDATNSTVRFYRYDGSSFNEVTGSVLSNADYISKISSNGNQAIVSGYANGTKNRLTDGVSAYDIFGKGNLSDAVIGWNGKSWTIVQTKNLSRLSGSFLSQSIEDYGRTGDRLLTLAGDGNGRLLVGGALSTIDRDDPSFPLTAKLVMVTEGVTAPNNGSTIGGNFGGDRVYTSSMGPRVLVQGDPSDFRVGNGKEFAYKATATDTDGVDRVELYVNGALIKTCYVESCEFRSTYFTNGASTRSVKFSVRATDRRGFVTETVATPDYLTVDLNSSGSAGGANTGAGNDTASGISSWTWLEPNTTTLNNDQSAAFNVGAWDTNGLKRIEIYVNGSVIRTCDFNNATGNQTCATTLYANNYSQGTNVHVNAKITDANNNMAWTSSTTLTRSGTSGTGSSTGSIWTSVDPSDTAFYANQTKTFTANAQDNDGLTRIELFVNGSIVRTCEFGQVTGTQNCNTTIYASNYSQGTNVSLNAKSTDRYGNTLWSDNKTLTRANDGSNGSGNSSGSIWTWLDPNTTTLNANQSVAFYAGAQDNDGLRRVEIYVNGSIIRTCDFSDVTGSQNCATTLYANNYSQGTTVSVNAKATDRFGNSVWSNITNLTRSNDGSSGNNTGSNSAPSVWEWVEPNVSSIATNGSVLYGVGAWDQDGMNTITIYVNGVARTPCSFNSATGNQQCTFTLNGSNYAAGSNVFLNAMARDSQGRETWTSGKTVRVDTTSNGGSTPTTPSANGSVSISTNHPNTYRKNETLSYTTTGSDADGIDRVEIYVNAVKVKTCTGTANCSVTVGPFNTRLLVTYGAVLFDKNGNSVTSGYKQTFLSQ